MCEFISLSYTYVSWSSPLTLSLRNLRRASLGRIQAYADKGNFILSNRERIFLRNFFLICEFISLAYNIDLRKQFANTLFVESAKWYLGAYWSPWWERKYPHIITKEKLSEKLHCHGWIISQSYTFLFSDQFVNTVFWKSAIRDFIAQWDIR